MNAARTSPPSAVLSEIDLKLLNDYQRGFPLQPRPFATLAEQLGITEQEAIERLRHLRESGAISRVGAVIRPNVIGASALATLAVPPERLEDVAKFINAFPEINHNYEREHRFNLWFVATAVSAERLRAVFDEIEEVCECGPVLVLPMMEEYHIDLGFDLLASAAVTRDAVSMPRYDAVSLSEQEQQIIAVLQEGLPMVERPYSCLGLPEQEAIALLTRWIDAGIVKRFGVIVRHHELGYTANAMTVWNVPDDKVTEAGQRLAASGGVTLCYRRTRHLPQWPYNLFCMIHGKDREDVQARIDTLATTCGLDAYPRAVLFSCRRFKQRGAHYTALPKNRHG